MTKAIRTRQADLVVKELRDAKNLVLIDYHKLKANQNVALRGSLRKDGVRMRVLKNAVARRALETLGHKALADRVTGMNAVLWADDPVTALKAFYKFKEANNVLDVRGATIEGLVMEAPQLKALSSLPSKPVLQGAFVATLAAPAQNFVNVLNTAVGQFVQVLHAAAEKNKGQA